MGRPTVYPAPETVNLNSGAVSRSHPAGSRRGCPGLGGPAWPGPGRCCRGCAGGPRLVTGLAYMMAAAVWAERSMLILGGWLAATCVAAAWTGPVNVLLVEAAAGGGGFLAASMLLAWRRRW
jgi:hypothetical protein